MRLSTDIPTTHEMELVYWEATPGWLAESRLARGLIDTVCRSAARRRLVELDHLSPARCQALTLRGLVHQAGATTFGRDHDFRRIRTADDFRRLVPLSTGGDSCHVSQNLNSVEASANGTTTPVASSPALATAHRKAFFTALAFVANARPRRRVFSGRFLFLEDDSPGAPAAPCAPFPFLMRLQQGDKSGCRPAACVAGETSRLMHFFTRLQEKTGQESITALWPGLTAVLYQRRPGDAGRAELARILGTTPGMAPILLETCWRSEGPITAEDPRYGLLRLIPDLGVYYELVPVEEIGKAEPIRHGVAELEPGTSYTLALTSPPGLWARLVGVTMRCERRDPPLFQMIETARPAEQPTAKIAPTVRKDAQSPRPAQPPHPRSSDIPAALAGMLGHISS